MSNDKLAALLRECLADYSHPHFTDRGGMADRIRAALQAHATEAAQAQAQSGEWVQKAIVDAKGDIEYVHVRIFNAMKARAEEAEAMLAAAQQPQAAESHKGLLIGTTPSGVPYSLHGTKESVTAVSDMLEQAEVSRQLGADQPQSAEPVAYRAEWNVDVSDEGVYVYCQPNERDSEHQLEPLYTHPQPAQDAALYQELLMAVEKKFPGESRHETALRYIRQAELRSCEPKCDSSMAKESGR